MKAQLQMQNTLKYYSSRDLCPTFFMCGKGHSIWLEVLNKAITCRVYFYICYGLLFKDVKYSSSCQQTNRELLTVFGSCHCVLYIVSVWGMCMCVLRHYFILQPRQAGLKLTIQLTMASSSTSQVLGLQTWVT